MDVEVKLPFDEFIKTYMSAKTLASTKDIVPIVLDESGQLLELYSYKLMICSDDEDSDETTIVTHPDYMEIGLDAYTDFLLDMQRAFNEKNPS
jgi:hypothetical protein